MNDAKKVLERMRSEGMTAERQYEDMQGYPGSGYSSRLGTLLLEGADALAASEARVREAAFLLASTPRNVAPPESLSLRIDVWLAASEPPGEEGT
jgi:hypothetical protein